MRRILWIALVVANPNSNQAQFGDVSRVFAGLHDNC
jgi:hypothetical protein